MLEFNFSYFLLRFVSFDSSLALSLFDFRDSFCSSLNFSSRSFWMLLNLSLHNCQRKHAQPPVFDCIINYIEYIQYSIDIFKFQVKLTQFSKQFQWVVEQTVLIFERFNRDGARLWQRHVHKVENAIALWTWRETYKCESNFLSTCRISACTQEVEITCVQAILCVIVSSFHIVLFAKPAYMPNITKLSSVGISSNYNITYFW